MDNQLEISPEFFSFISFNQNADPDKLRLKYHGKSMDFDVDFAIDQIQCRKKAAGKLRKFVENEKLLFPSILAAEQASHEAVASYHASLIRRNATLADLTAGLGIDVMTMARNCRQATACELDPLKAAILRYNASILGLTNLQIMEGDSIKWLLANDAKFDYIFIDPTRRGEGNVRTYNFHDCQPDILLHMRALLDRCSKLLIKASPLLDITQTVRDIEGIMSIRAICVKGECKEILIEASDKFDSDNTSHQVVQEAVDIDEAGKIISQFNFSKEISSVNASNNPSSTLSPYEEPLSYEKEDIEYASERDIVGGHYLYEPNAAMMKLAPWPELTNRFKGLKKLEASSHLFVSEYLHRDFPGRVLKIEKLIDKKSRKTLKGFPANVAVRNYPKSAQELRKELGVKEGKDLFIYGTRLNKPLLLLAEKINP